MKTDFDFFIGTWNSRHRRLRKVLAGCDEWDEFPGATRCWGVLDGAGNIDEILFPTLGYGGLTVRLWDEQRYEWSLYWANSRTGLALPPQVGRFTDGVGVFTGDDEYGGRPVQVVYRWSEITPRSCRWEQAFSADGGRTWETNWISEFERTG